MAEGMKEMIQARETRLVDEVIQAAKEAGNSSGKGAEF
jgi:hypothetical protein